LLKHDPAGLERGFHGRFNRWFERVTASYVGGVSRATRRLLRSLLIYAVIVAIAAWAYLKLPGSFLPEEDQGYLVTAIQLPPAATRERAQAVLESVEQFYLKQPQVDKVVGVLGFSFFGRGQNMALAFVRLKDWDDRPGKENSAQSLIKRANMEFFRMKQAMLFAINPPPIPELASAGGFDFRLQDRGGVGREKLLEARNQVLGMAMGDKRLTAVRPEGQEPAPQLFLDIDRDKAETLGIAAADLNDTLQSLFGVSYINDFVRQGRVLRVQMQAEETTRRSEADLMRVAVRNSAGRMVRLSEFVRTRWVAGGAKLDRYNGLAAMKISGATAQGVSSGEALAAMEAIAQKLPPGIGFEWSGISSEEKISGQQAPLLFGVSLLVVRAARCLRRAGRGGVARTAQRRLFQGRADRHHRAGRQERHPDRRVRAPPRGRRARAPRCRAGSLPPAPAPDPDDFHRLCRGRVSAGHFHRRGRREPPRHRHRRHRRHGRRHRIGDIPGAGVLHGGAAHFSGACAAASGR
ncbi:MAG: hydrophobic/amphiphilic exporter-1 (mainly G- bacteria) HAE1 family, partial [Gallionellaceae bacterium]